VKQPAYNHPGLARRGRFVAPALLLSALLACAILVPVCAGLLGAALPASGYFPALGGHHFSHDPAANFLSLPGLSRSITLAVSIGIGATLLSLIASFAVLCLPPEWMPMRWLRRLMGPLIAVPHSTIAIGVLFLLAPSGWFMRIISPELTGLERPPLWALVPDQSGYGLVFALMAKEIPFLIIVSMAALATLPVSQLVRVSSSLGYGRAAAWWLVILPLVYRRIRLPLAAVLIFSLSVVDMTLLLGPSLPPTLAVLVVQGFQDADLAMRFPASFGACLQIIVTLFVLLIWRLGEHASGFVLGFMRHRGRRLRNLNLVSNVIGLCASIPVLAGVMGLVAAALWSVAGRWIFPQTFPLQFSWRYWQRIDALLPAFFASLVIAIGASLLAVAVTLVLLRRWPDGRIGPLLRAGICAPLLLPQVSFLPGLQIMLTILWLDGSWSAMIGVHALFILPYAWMVLAPASAGLDTRYDMAAASLGASGFRRYYRITLPLLAPSIIAALFIGTAVSIALYLPSLFAGAGRITTVTLEAVALASGGSRQMAGIAAILQLMIPLCAFILLHGWYRWKFGKYTAMRAGGLH